MSRTSYLVPISIKGVVFEEKSVWLRKNERKEWELSGGKLDVGEQPRETVVRELREELGFEVEVVDIVQAHIYSIKSFLRKSNDVLIITYLCKLVEKVGRFEIKGEAGRAQFKKFKVEEIKGIRLSKFYKEAINKAFKLNNYRKKKKYRVVQESELD